MKRLITCLIINIIMALVIFKSFAARVYSYNMIMEQYNKNGSGSLEQVIRIQKMDIIIEGAALVLCVVGIIILITLISREKNREYNRPVMINYNNTDDGPVQTNYISPGYSGGADHRVDPEKYGGNING